MIITNIEQYKSKRYKVYVDDKFAFVLYSNEVKSLDLEVGEQIDDEKYSHIVDDIIYKRGLSYCNYSLAKKDRSVLDMTLKLRDKFYPEDVIDKIIKELIERGYLNDDKFAASYVEYKKDAKSTEDIRIKLIQKGISREVIDEVIKTITYEDQMAAAKKYINKKTNKYDEKNKYIDAMKLRKYLIGKQFDFDIIDDALKDYE